MLAKYLQKAGIEKEDNPPSKKGNNE